MANRCVIECNFGWQIVPVDYLPHKPRSYDAHSRILSIAAALPSSLGAKGRIGHQAIDP
jgi:hypothetical protein